MNEYDNDLISIKDKNNNDEKKCNVKFVSFSEYDENNQFREAYGYFEKDESGTTLEERVEEMAKMLGKR